MGRLRKYKVRNLCLAGLLLCGSACTKEDTVKDFPKGESPQVEVHTRAMGENATATLLFWRDADFHNWVAGNSDVKPYGKAGMERDIDNYQYEKKETFSTGLTYPEGDDYLYATGYAPAKALQPEADNNYLKLQVAQEYQNGKTDFLCCDGNEAHRGSSVDPFTVKEHELNFRHLTSRIRFVGKRDPVMYDVISVNNVWITLHNAGEKEWFIPTEFSLYTSASKNPENLEEDKCTYVVSDSIAPDTILLSPVDQNYIPVEEEGLNLSECYVHQTYPEDYDPFGVLVEGNTGTIQLTLDITADFSWYNNGDPVWYETHTWEGCEVEVNSDYGDTMLPGCEYVVYITFSRESVILQGVQQAWEDGGIHYLPVVPDKSKE